MLQEKKIPELEIEFAQLVEQIISCKEKIENTTDSFFIYGYVKQLEQLEQERDKIVYAIKILQLNK